MISSNTLSMCGEGLNMSYKMPMKRAMVWAYSRYSYCKMVLTEPEDYIKMEMQMPRSSKMSFDDIEVRSLNCSVQKSFVIEERGLNWCEQTSSIDEERGLNWCEQTSSIDEERGLNWCEQTSLFMCIRFESLEPLFVVVDSDVDDAPKAQTLFMANLSSADPVYDEAGPSYDSDVLSEVQNHDHYQDAICDHHDEHEMHDDVQPNHVVDSHADYMSDSNMTPYGQYIKDNAVPVIQNNASIVPNDAYVMIDNDVHESDVLSISHTPQNTVVKLATYKEQVELYERRARFELTEREQKIDEQLRIVICDRNIKEENLKKELHSKENKYLDEFLDLKALKDKVEDKLFKQGQSIQIVHMMCKPRSYYDEVNKVAIGYKNPLCLHRARQVQPALYSGHVIVTPNHVPAVVCDGEETLELTEISRKKMHEKMKANECVDNKVVHVQHQPLYLHNYNHRGNNM
ncbi:hypothetical protein Tco_0282104 [Tanacetum coccineum]